MEPKLETLSINQDGSKARFAASQNKSRKQVADSWDEDIGSDEEVGNITPSKKSPVPDPPPPTPASPRSGFPSWDAQEPVNFGSLNREKDLGERRPEKSTAVAGRLIASGLGMRAPKKTEEQKAYDRAARENEIRRRMKEKEAKEKEREENEQAKEAVWDA
jgi:hypothetical protein